MNNSEVIILNKENGIATVTLNRPDEANGINIELGEALYDTFRELNYDDEIRVVVLKGAGKFFSAGGDLKYMVKNKEKISSAVKILADTLHRTVSLITRMEKPVIIGVNGIAAGAGFSLSMAGDFVIAAESAKFVMAYTNAGLSPDGGATYNLPRLIGVRKTMELMVANKKLTAKDALDWNLITTVVPDNDLDTALNELALKISKGAIPAFASVKRLLNTSFSTNIETQMEYESREIAKNAGAPHGKEGINAFMEKRSPKF